MTNRLTAEKKCSISFMNIFGSELVFSESFMQVDVNSFENSNTLIDHMNSNNLLVSTLIQRRKHAKLDRN